MQNLVLFPYSGTAIEALDCINGQWNCIGFISDDNTIIGQRKYGIEIFGREALNDFTDAKVLTVHGSPSSFLQREQILHSLRIAPEGFATVIHPKAVVSKNAKIGKNVLIMAGVVITSNAVVGDHVVILPNTVIHHDSFIGDFTLIGANATIAGNVSIGRNCYVGAASSIKNGITISDCTLVGIGANVIASNGEAEVLIGNPARRLKKS